MKYQVLSIDAWNSPDGWTWNNWFDAGHIEVDIDASTRTILKTMRDGGYLSAGSAGKVYIDDDQYNLVICARGTMEPVFAIVYGDSV